MMSNANQEKLLKATFLCLCSLGWDWILFQILSKGLIITWWPHKRNRWRFAKFVALFWSLVMHSRELMITSWASSIKAMPKLKPLWRNWRLEKFLLSNFSCWYTWLCFGNLLKQTSLYFMRVIFLVASNYYFYIVFQGYIDCQATLIL